LPWLKIGRGIDHDAFAAFEPVEHFRAAVALSAGRDRHFA
jgi:hypothetical protein